jgi:hypothetical protein
MRRQIIPSSYPETGFSSTGRSGQRKNSMLFLVPGKYSILQFTVFQMIIHRQRKRRYAAGIIDLLQNSVFRSCEMRYINKLRDAFFRFAGSLIRYEPSVIYSAPDRLGQTGIRCRTLRRKQKNEPEEHLLFLSFSLTDQDSNGILALEILLSSDALTNNTMNKKIRNNCEE